MKRLSRWLFHAFAGLSLLLCLATAIFWVVDRDSNTCQELILGLRSKTAAIIIDNWHVFVVAGSNDDDPANVGLHFVWDNSWSLGFYCDVFTYLYEPKLLWRHLGDFGGTVYRGRPHEEIFRAAAILMVPAWFAVTLFAIPPGFVAFRFFRRKKKRKAGSCLTCGYDLRATPDRCPECGTIPAKERAKI
jgi:hypothetical protein